MVMLLQFWAAYVPCDSQYKDAVQLTLEQIDVIRRFTELYHPKLTLCTSSEGNDPDKRSLADDGIDHTKDRG